MESFELFGFNIYAWITIVTVLSMFTVLLLTKLRTDLVFLGAIAVLYVTGVLDAKEAFSGFSSTSVVVIGVGCAPVDSEESLGTAQFLFQGCRPPNAPCGCAKFVPQQYHRRGPLREYRQDVVEETQHLPLQVAHPPELCLGHGRCVYVDRNAAEPDHLWPLCREDRHGDEHSYHHHPRPLLSLRRRTLHHRHAQAPA